MATAFLYGTDLHHLDHLAPLSVLLSIPLSVTDPDIAHLARTYYPMIDVHLLSSTEFASHLLDSYSVVFTCLPRQLIAPLFFFEEHRARKKLLTFWLPHGNSDKDNLGALTQEKLLLVYGPQMIDILKKKHILNTTFRHIATGNFRAHFFQQHLPFYEKLLNKELSFRSSAPMVLYAPTWNASPIERDLPHLINTLPDTYNLAIKLHPNTYSNPKLVKALESCSDRHNIKVLNNLPTIFPLLSRTSFLLSDASSIAYDFLYFNRPLFFLEEAKTPIHTTGPSVLAETVYFDLAEKDTHQKARQDLYSYAFQSGIDYKTLPQVIKKAYTDYINNEVHIL